MAYIATINLETLENSDSYKSPLNDQHECVALVQALTNAPNTTGWRKGVKVIDARPGSISPGTIIATFDENGYYPGANRHAAIYVTHDEKGILVYDQWATQGKVKKRFIRKRKNPSSRNVNDANYYWVVI